MENIDYWKHLWQALVENGTSAKNEEAAHRFWLTLTPSQQAFVSTTITRKVNERKFVWFDPIRAIKETLRRCPTSTPEFLNGQQQDAAWNRGETLVQVKVGNEFRICTLQTQQDFHLTLVKPWPKMAY